MYKRILVVVTVLSCLLTGCSSDNNSNQEYPSDYPTSKSYTVDEILYPEASGALVLDSDVAKVDYSNTNQGYVMAFLKPGVSKRIKKVYEFVANYINYDDDKVALAKQQYLIPNLDEIINNKKGICFDYASMMTAMLRINHIPARLICGGTDKDEYHSWLEVYVKGQGWVNPDIFMDKDTWTIMDPTFASTKYDYEGKYVETARY